LRNIPDLGRQLKVGELERDLEVGSKVGAQRTEVEVDFRG
jgi:hypothetical protein